MSFGSSDGPDTVGAAEEQGEQALRLNEAQTAANRPNQYNAWGSTEWSRDPTTNQWIQTETLDPRLQGAADSQLNIQEGRSKLAEGMMGRAWDSYSNPMDFDQYGGPIAMGDVQGVDRFSVGDEGIAGFRQNAEDAAYQRATSRLDPQFQQQEQATLTKLRNQGLQPGDQAYDAAVANFSRGKNDAYEQARLGSTAEGRSEAGQLFGQELQASGLNTQQQQQEFGQATQQNQIANKLRDQQIQEDLYKRGYSLDEVERLLVGQGVTGGPPSSGGQTQTENPTYLGGQLRGETR